MIPSDQSEHRNRLLALMAPADFGELAGHLEHVQLTQGFVIVEPGGAIDWVYFPETSIVSIVAALPSGDKVEVGLFGREGVGPLPIIIGSSRSVHRIIVQVAGTATRIEATTFTRLVFKSASLHGLLDRYVLVMYVQATFTALSHAVQEVEARLARWLLMCHDRLEGVDVALTQGFLATMLAVRRPTVTTTIQLLERNGSIRSARARITICDREALEVSAAESYGGTEAEYARLIGPIR